MAIKSLGTYDFPSRSAVELYGGNIMVNLIRRDSAFYCSPATVLVPPSLTWKEFVDTQVMPYCTADPDFNAGGSLVFKLVEEDFDPVDDKTLDELGVKHKNTVSIDVK